MGTVVPLGRCVLYGFGHLCAPPHCSSTGRAGQVLRLLLQNVLTTFVLNMLQIALWFLCCFYAVFSDIVAIEVTGAENFCSVASSSATMAKRQIVNGIRIFSWHSEHCKHANDSAYLRAAQALAAATHDAGSAACLVAQRRQSRSPARQRRARSPLDAFAVLSYALRATR